MTDIKNARILIIATDGFEQSELLVPRDKLRAAGARVDIATRDGENIKSWHDKNWGETVQADLSVRELDPSTYDALVLPGGQMNPDILRTDDNVVQLVRTFHKNGKIIAAVCHAPWLLIEAAIIRGRKATSYHSIKTDMINAGAEWVDEEVVADNGIVTSRSPADLEAFVAKIIEEVREGRHQRHAA